MSHPQRVVINLGQSDVNLRGSIERFNHPILSFVFHVDNITCSSFAQLILSLVWSVVNSVSTIRLLYSVVCGKQLRHILWINVEKDKSPWTRKWRLCRIGGENGHCS
jgi:hypothetical protein